MSELKPMTAEDRAEIQGLYDSKQHDIMSHEKHDGLLPVVKALDRVKTRMLQKYGRLRPWLCGEWALISRDDLPRLLADVERLEKQVEAGREAAKALVTCRSLINNGGLVAKHPSEAMDSKMATSFQLTFFR